MQPGSWEEQKPEIWQVLPLHPRPQPLESLTSYLTRTASANGFQSLSELGALAGGRTSSLLQRGGSAFCEYSTLSFSALAQLTGVPTARWLDMTFFHLIQRFGRGMHPLTLRKFLEGSLSPTLRYCPQCLAEQTPAYYSLLWRFLVLPGCLNHRVHFLNQCGHCGFSLPLLSPLPQLTTCPLCQGDLRSSVPSPLESSLTALTERYTNDLKRLLAPGLQRSGEACRETLSASPTPARSFDARGSLLDGSRGLDCPVYRLGENPEALRSQATLLGRLSPVCCCLGILFE